MQFTLWITIWTLIPTWYRIHHMERATEKELLRFRSRYQATGDCLLWKGRLDKDGYGSFHFRKKPRRAHRVAFYLSQGDIPAGMVIDHICKNRHCVAISHLRVITQAQNTLENSNSLGAQNKMKTQCKYGHPFDRKYSSKKGFQRYCSICQAAKTKRLRKKWASIVDPIKC